MNLEFPKDEFRISRDCFASLAMTKILEFPIEIPQSSWGMTKKVKSWDDTRLREF